MNPTQYKIATIASFIAFAFGVAINLSLASTILWGELEASTYVNQIGDESLRMHCPVLLSKNETGTVSTSITNTVSTNVSPSITTQVNQFDEMMSSSQVVDLVPDQTISVERDVNSQHLLFDRIILVSIIQGRYDDLPSRQGTCSILVADILGISGGRALLLLLIASLILNAGGVGALLYLHAPLSEYKKNLGQACGLLLIASVLSLLSTFSAAWGLALVFIPLAGLTVLIIFTEVIFLPKK